MDFPFISIVIPVRPEEKHIPAIEACLNFDYPKNRYEIILTKGYAPSKQRNEAVNIAKGEWIYFLDNDSEVFSENLLMIKTFTSLGFVHAVGGPSLCPVSAPFLEKIFATVCESYFAFGPSRSRYIGVGRPREAGEKALIFCNMTMQKNIYQDIGGLNPKIYPNEENILYDQLQKKNIKLYYHPAFKIDRRPRESVKEFCIQIFRYGRGRAEQVRMNPSKNSIINFIPSVFLLYLISLFFISAPIYWTPILLYFGFMGIQGVFNFLKKGFLLSVCAIPFITLTHLLYGIGVCWGLFTEFQQMEDSEVVLEVIQF